MNATETYRGPTHGFGWALVAATLIAMAIAAAMLVFNPTGTKDGIGDRPAPAVSVPDDQLSGGPTRVGQSHVAPVPLDPTTANTAAREGGDYGLASPSGPQPSLVIDHSHQLW